MLRRNRLPFHALVFVSAASVAGASFFACSGDPDTPAQTEEDATAPTEDGSPNGRRDGGPGDEPDATPPTALEACLIYVQATCERANACGRTLDCDIAASQCPDAVFADGAGQTPEGAVRCAEARRKQACSEVLANVTPDCVAPGTLPGGEPCRFGAQCASARCLLGGGAVGCGTCASASLDGGCSEPNTACNVNEQCVSGACRPIAVVPDLPPGAACSVLQDSGTCSPETPCTASAVNQREGVCQALNGVGGACRYTLRALSGSCRDGTCGLVDAGADVAPRRECVARRGAGEACGTTLGIECAEGLFCSPSTRGSCTPQRRLNETCGGDGPCIASLFCERTTPEGGLCKPRRAIGSSCDPIRFDGSPSAYPVECEEGATCEIEDESSARFCFGPRRPVGQPCVARSYRCAPGATCNADGLCEYTSCADAGP